MDALRPIAGTPASATTGMSPADEKKLRATAHEVESLFMTHLLKTMRQASGMGKTPLSGNGQRVYQDLMDEELGRTLSKSGGLGLGDMLVRDVLRRQGVEKKPSSPAADRPIEDAGGLQ